MLSVGDPASTIATNADTLVSYPRWCSLLWLLGSWIEACVIEVSQQAVYLRAMESASIERAARIQRIVQGIDHGAHLGDVLKARPRAVVESA
jgi:hypothetical protein